MQTNTVSLKRDLGLAAATAIVVGNTIGSGIFMAPQALAAVANPAAAMTAWIITAVGSFLLAVCFAKMGAAYPATGGPIVFTRKAFGEFPAFQIAWIYWIGSWVGNATIITGFVSYFTYFFPVFGRERILAFLLSSAVLWTFTIINILGVRKAGNLGIVTTTLKILPLLAFIAIAAFFFEPANLATVSKPELTGFTGLPAAIAITLWAFVGLECATIPAGEIRDPSRNIRRSTLYGIFFTALLYLVVSFVAMGGMPQADLAVSSAPLADIITRISGISWGGPLIAFGAVISTLGAVSGWVLTTARSAYSAGESGLFPAVMAKVHPRTATPHVALIVSAVLTNLLLILNYTQNLTSAFKIMLLLATLAFLPVYAFTAAAEMQLLVRRSSDFCVWRFIKDSFFSLLAFAYSIYAIYGTGAEVVMYGFILMLLGIPFYVYVRRSARL